MSLPLSDNTRRSEDVKLDTLDNKQVRESALSKQEHVHDLETQNEDDNGIANLPILEGAALQRWNEPRGNIARFGATFYSIFVFGLSDAAYGALLPYVGLQSPSEGLID